MANYEYSSYSSSSTGGGAGGAGGFDVAKAIFKQADTNQDGGIDRDEFQQWVANAGGAGGAGGSAQFGAGGAGQFGAGGAGQFNISGAGGAEAALGSSSYESSSFSSSGGGDALLAAGSPFESSNFSGGAGFDAGAVGGGLQTSSSFESSSTTGGFDASVVSQAASYTAETNAAWSRYGAEVTGAGLYVDANPQIIRRPAAGGIQTYTQNIKVRFLQPPPIPPPGVSDNILLFCFIFITTVFL
jgi:hypothetical protein